MNVLAQVSDPDLSEHVRAFLSDAAVFLIFGGLSIVALIVLLVILRSLFPDRQKVDIEEKGPASRHLKRTPSLEGRHDSGHVEPPDIGDLRAGHDEAASATIADVDAALDHFARRHLGDPRLLSVEATDMRIRIYRCADCSGEGGGVRRACGRVLGFLEGALRQVWGHDLHVEEVTCRRFGGDVCEFALHRAATTGGAAR